MMTSLRKTALTLGFAAGALVAATTASLAAYATTAVNVRSGPGTQYGVVDQLSRGEYVEIDRCVQSWCFVLKDGPDGWVSARYLTQDDDGFFEEDDVFYDDDVYVRPRPIRPVRPYRPWRDPRASVCIGGPNASFCISD